MWLIRKIIVILPAMLLFLSEASGQEGIYPIYFENNQRELTGVLEEKIDSLTATWVNGCRIDIKGYADYIGSENYNRKLSAHRAENVADYLKRKGFTPAVVFGAGEQLPAYPDKRGVAGNRRVDIIYSCPVEVAEYDEHPIVQEDANPNTSTLETSVAEADTGDHLVLKGLYFIPGRHYLRPESVPVLDELVQIMNDNPGLVIEVQGHICCDSLGRDGLDLDTGEEKLSVNRAKYVRNYLIGKGIESRRVSYRGMARTMPVVNPEVTEEDRNRNRRVEIIIIEK